MKNLLLIAFATLALAMGANFIDACPNCEGKQVVKADEKKADKAEKKDADADKAAADTKEANAVTETKVETKASTGCCKRASAGQLVKADRDAAGCCGGCCTKAKDGKGNCCGGCCNKKEGCGNCGGGCGCGGNCGGGGGGNCGGGCEKGGCDTAKADSKEEKAVKD